MFSSYIAKKLLLSLMEMSVFSTSGFAVRRNGSCLSNEVECGTINSPLHSCCPTSTSCSSQNNAICCSSTENCVNALLSHPTCANQTWTLYNDSEFFCCESGMIGFSGSSAGSYGCADPKCPPGGIQWLSMLSARQSKIGLSM